MEHFQAATSKKISNNLYSKTFWRGEGGCEAVALVHPDIPGPVPMKNSLHGAQVKVMWKDKVTNVMIKDKLLACVAAIFM